MNRLLIFLKYPQPGQVKTRLAGTSGEEAAAAVARSCVELTLERMAAFRCDAVLCIDPPSALGRARAWLGSTWAMWPQHGEDLGRRLAHATARAFEEGARLVVVIGTDSPWIRQARITEAFASLDTAQLVLGPTEDGGYYLIGLSHALPGLFEGIAWGSSFVLAQTQSAASRLGLTVSVLEAGYDLDHAADVQRFLEAERHQHEILDAVKTIAALSERRVACGS